MAHFGLPLFLFGAFSQGCKGQATDRVAQAERRIGAALRKAAQDVDSHYGAPVFLRIFKEERELEVWLKQDGHQRKFALLKTYRIAGMSGKLGPKLAEGDLQAPEGFYHVSPARMNPKSQFHLSFNLGFPNAYDRAKGHTGSFLMVHGGRASIGCYAMTDKSIEEIYLLCKAALDSGQPYFRVHCFPFRMTAQRLEREKESPWHSFWLNLKEGHDLFERTWSPPRVEVSDGHYIFP